MAFGDIPNSHGHLDIRGRFGYPIEKENAVWLSDSALDRALAQAEQEVYAARPRFPAVLPQRFELASLVASAATCGLAHKAIMNALAMTSGAALRISRAYCGVAAKGSGEFIAHDATVSRVIANGRPATLAHIAGFAIATGTFWAKAVVIEDPTLTVSAEEIRRFIDEILLALVKSQLNERAISG